MKKNGKIELLRFLAAMMIVDGHIASVFGEEGNFARPFSSAWFYVEFFLMLTGYFTAKHFARLTNAGISVDQKVMSGLKYTVKKFATFLPFTSVPIILMYLVSKKYIYVEQGLVPYLCSMENMPFELFYLSAGMESGTLLFPLWFISAMFLVFPFYCLVCQAKHRKIFFLAGGYAAFFYYFSKYDFGSHVYPNQLVRTAAGLLIGFCIFQFSKYLSECRIDRKGKYLLSCVEVVTALVPIVLSFWNFNLLRLYLACFVLFLTVVFSGQSFIPAFSNPFFLYLGRLSMPVYIWHYLVGTILNRYGSLTLTQKVFLLFAITLVLSVLNLALVDFVKWMRKQVRKS